MAEWIKVGGSGRLTDPVGSGAVDARQGRALDPDQAVIVRVVDYTVPGREGDHIRLITTILDPAEATAQRLAHHGRREAESGFARLKTHLRGPSEGSRGPRPRTWSARRSGPTSSPTGPWPP